LCKYYATCILTDIEMQNKVYQISQPVLFQKNAHTASIYLKISSLFVAISINNLIKSEL